MAERVPRIDDHDRSTPELIRAIASDTSELVRKEVQLAKQEIVETIPSMVRAAAGVMIAGVVAFVALIVLALAIRDALDLRLATWAADLITAGIMLVIASIAGMQITAMRKVARAPEETKRTVKEDVAWAKRQLKR